MMKRGILLMGLLALLSCRAKKEVQQMAVTAEAQTLVDSMAWGGLKTQLQEVEAIGREIDEVCVELSAWDDGVKKRRLKIRRERKLQNYRALQRQVAEKESGQRLLAKAHRVAYKHQQKSATGGNWWKRQGWWVALVAVALFIMIKKK
jgi:lipoprotein